MRSLLASAVLLSLLAPVAAVADEPRPTIDPADPCGSSPAVPAVSGDGRLVAVVRCWSDLSDAQETTFELIRRSDGRVVRAIPIFRASTGGDDPTPDGIVARSVRQANRVLLRGGFRSLVPMVDDDGNAVRLTQGAAAGLLLSYDPGAGQVVIADASSGRVRGAEALEQVPAHPYCCGFDMDDWDTATCGMTPVVQGAWADADANVVVVESAAYDGPDGCEEGPEWVVLALAR